MVRLQFSISLVCVFFNHRELTLFEVALLGEPSLDRPGIFSEESNKRTHEDKKGG